MLKELGDYKNRLWSLFVNNDNICKLIFGQNYIDEVDDLDTESDKYMIPHLYVPDTITQTKSYIMYETYCKGTNGQTKTMQIVIQAICHKDIVKYVEKPSGYSGLRYDVLAEFIEEILCPEDRAKKNEIIKKFGIGGFELKSADIFLTKDFIGRTLTFIVPDFR